MKQFLTKLEIGEQTVMVSGLYHNSKLVRPQGLFFALSGASYIAEAVDNGATVVITEVGVEVPQSVTHIVVDDVRESMALVSKQFYGNVVDQMRVTGIVGTNGKTTTAYLVRHILEMATGKNVGLIGTTGIYGAGQQWNGVTTLTTPDPIELHQALSAMYHNGVRDVVMEVSAHAIYYRKVAGISYAGVIFTNITQDHLDFFQTFEHYKNTKILFFRELKTGTVVINADDKYGLAVADAVRNKPMVKAISYSLQQDTIVGTAQWAFVDKVKLTVTGSDFNLSKVGACHLALPGLYNVYNAVAAALLCNDYGVKWPLVQEALSTVSAVPGRFNTYNIKGVTAIIDYAHTPDGLEKLLTNAKALLPAKAHLTVVFGCGGDRDRSKRPLMGKIAAQIADHVVLTSDNPRTEDPDAIIDEIERGIVTMDVAHMTANLDGTVNQHVRFVDRIQAINYAIEHAAVGDIVVIAGKGHENYIDIKGQKIPYMDRKVLDNILRG